MELEQIRKTVDRWIVEEEYPSSTHLKVERTSARYFNPCEDMEDEEATAYWEFIYGIVLREHALLFSIPKPEAPDFWAVDLDEFGNNVSAFNTYDYERLYPFNKYQWKLNRIYHRVKDLAITHSCASDEQGRFNIHQRYLNLVKSEFRKEGIIILEHYKKYKIWMNKYRVFSKIEELNSRIRICKKIWKQYAYWE